MPDVSDWLGEEEVAAWLSVPVESVRSAIQAGEIPSLSVGGFVRVSRDALLALAANGSGRPPTIPTATATADRSRRGGIPCPLGLSWISELAGAPPFDHGWPKRGGGTFDEHYFSAWEGTISLQDERLRVTVGQCTRHDRGRMTVFFNRTPICEFTETLDGENWASIIKPDSRKTLRVNGIPPALYRDARIEAYREITGMAGSGVPNGAAVVIARDDLRSAVHHTAARWLGRRRFPVEPST